MLPLWLHYVSRYFQERVHAGVREGRVVYMQRQLFDPH
jgi:hypothetical protein